MAAPEPTHIVVHPRLFLSVKGELQHVEKGTQLALDDATAKRLGSSKVVPINEEAVEIDTGSEGDELKVSPQAKNLADEHGIDLETITGTGQDGAITKSDVQAAVDALEG